MVDPLRAEHVLALSFTRSVGGPTEAFLRGLSRGELWGSRDGDQVVVPPVEPGVDLVRVADTGVVRSWTWVDEPADRHPLDRPFAFALVQLDGSSSSLLHVVDAGAEEAMSIGMRVHADWRTIRSGSIRDIRAFVPGDVAAFAPGDEPEQVQVASRVEVSYAFEPGLTLSRFFRALAEHRIEGGRCTSCGAVFVPPRAGCPTCGGQAMEPAELPDRGTIVSYTVIHLPVPGMDVPFAWAWIRLDGADVPFAHLLADVEAAVGQRVEAVWADEPEPSWEAIRHFRSPG